MCMGYTTTPVVIWRDTSPTRVTRIYSQWSCEFVNLMHIGPDQIYNYDHDFVLLEFYTGIPRFTLLMWGHI